MASNRYRDLAQTAYNRGIPTFTDFLDLMQQTEYMKFISGANMPPVKSFLNGGLIFNSPEDDFLERKVACFYPQDTEVVCDTVDTDCNISVPISIIEINPLNRRFADELGHRDFLGAILNLGIERHMLGDILVQDNTAYVFAVSRIADYICRNLSRIKHTSVKAAICTAYDFSYAPSYSEVQGSVASERLDAVIAFAFNMSRNDASLFISSGRVFINAVQTDSKSHSLKEGDIVSVRGKGRFIFDGIISNTRKGRYFVKIRKGK